MNISTDPSNSEQLSFRTTQYPREEIAQISNYMLRCTSAVLQQIEFDQVLSGGEDTGTITLKSDMTLSELYIEGARQRGRFAFSEECDPVNASGVPLRQLVSVVEEYDPVDGSGDRKFGKPGTPSGDGYSSLCTLHHNGIIVAGVCVRPAHREVLVCTNQGVESYLIAEDYRSLTQVPFKRDSVVTNSKEIRVNRRPAYPNTNFPDEVLSVASELSKGKYKFVWEDAGGAGDCFARLLNRELEVVTSGRKFDWKTWDSDWAQPAFVHLGALQTTYRGHDLSARKITDADLWHTGGLMVSIGCDDAHELLARAIILVAEKNRLCEDGRPLIYDPRASSTR